jgi:hypothetical protein
VSQFLAGKGISAVEHPPSSPDLAPPDFCLFPELSFSDVEDIKSSMGGGDEKYSCSGFQKVF